MTRVWFSFTLFLVTFFALAQDQNAAGSEPFVPAHHLGLTIGHEHAFSGRNEDNKREVLILPFWGIDYDFHFVEKFSIGFHTDFIVESFEVEKNLDNGEEEVVERTRPIAPAIMANYKPSEHWTVSLGLGGEFSKEENFFLNRLAIEYGTEIRNGWEVGASIQYDFRWSAYDTWTIGLGISKSINAGRRR